MKHVHIFAVLALAGCQERGRFHLQYEWAHGAPPRGEHYAFLTIEERRGEPWISENHVLATAGPVRFDATRAIELAVTDVPNGDRRVAILELRASPGLDAPVTFYGISEPFTLAADTDVEVNIQIQPTSTPRAAPDELGLRVETNQGSGFVRSPKVSLVLITDTAKSARISNDRGFSNEERLSLTDTATAVEAPVGFSAYRAEWDLERGQREPCPVPGLCAREVFVRFADRHGYEGSVAADRVWLDTEPASLRAETSIDPPSAGPTTSVKVTLVATELLRRAPVLIAPSSHALRFTRILPAEDGPSSSYVYLLDSLPEPRPADGPYQLAAVLEDLAGNTSEPQIVGTLVLDGAPPAISALEVVPRRVGPSDELTVRFQVGEDLAAERLAVSLAGIPVRECARSGAAVECRYIMTGNEIPMGTQQSIAVIVWASDEALNRSALEAPVFADFAPPSLRDVSIYPTPARAGSSVTLRVAVSEALRSAPVLEWSSGVDPGFVWSPSLSSDFEHFFVRSVSATDRPGRFDLSQLVIEDAVGNRSAVSAGGVSLEVDNVAPVIGSLAVSPDRVGFALGRSVTVDLEVEEKSPAGTPRVTLGSDELACSVVQTSALIAQWRCTHVVHGGEIAAGSEAVLAVVAEAQDLAGNAGRASAPVVLDFQPPSVQSVVFLPNAARAGDRVRLTLTASEPLDPVFVPVLAWTGSSAPFTALAGASSHERSFELTVTPAIASGSYTLASVLLRDAAGNEATISTPSSTWQVDQVPPVVRDLAVDPARVPLAAGRPVTVTFEEHETNPASTRVTLGGAELGCTIIGGAPPVRAWRCTYATTGAEHPANMETASSVSVQLADEAGNTATASAPFVFDFLPPGIHTVQIAPEAARRGDAVRLYVAATEALDPAFVPVLSWSGASVPFVHRPSADSAFERYFDLTVAAALGSNTFTLASLTLRDVAGNEATVASGTTWLVDQVEPQIAGLEVHVPGGAGVTPPRVPFLAGRVIEATFTEVEAHPLGLRAALGARDVTSSCAITGGAPPSRTWRCAYTTTGAEYAAGVEATESFVVQVSDEADNRGSSAAAVVFDYAAPSLSAVTFAPAPAGIGATAELRLSANEELDPSFVPELAWSGRVAPFVHQPSLSGSLSRVFRWTPALSTTRTYVLASATLRDVAGNEATVPSGASWLLDTVAPVIGAVSIDTGHAALGLPPTDPPRINASAGRTLRVEFSVTEANLVASGPQVRVGALDISAGCTPAGSGATRTWTCTHSMSAANPPGLQVIDIRVTDTAGNVATNATATVVFDFSAPRLVADSAEVELIPAADNLLRAVSAARAGTTVSLRFEVDEALADAPVVFAAPDTLVFDHQPRTSEVLFAYTSVVPEGVATEGAHLLMATVTDLAGNTATIDLTGATFNIDTTAPADVDVTTIGRVVIDRRPWGDDVDATPRIALSGGPNAVEEEATVIVRSPFAPHAEITRIAASAGGSIPTTQLDVVDVATVHLQVIDGAGNASEAVAVRDGVWWASMNGKEPGTMSPNPHVLTVTPQVREALDQAPDGGAEREATADELDAVMARGGPLLAVRAEATWSRFEGSSTSPAMRRDHGMAYDARRGRTVMFGGLDAGGFASDETWEYDGERWYAVATGGARPSPRARPLMVYDAAREHVLLAGGETTSGAPMTDAWCYDGTSWTQLPGTTPFRLGASMAYHAGLGVTVMFGGRSGATDFNETWTFDGSEWLLASGTGAPAGRRDAAMAWLPDAAGGSLVMYGGRTVFAVLDETWSWNGTWRRHTPATRPPPLARVSLAMDPDFVELAYGVPKIVLFGGETSSGANTNQVWTWNGTTWSNRTAGAAWARMPSARIAPMVYDARNDRFTIFGGADGTTWSWDRTGWTDFTPRLDAPPARAEHAAAPVGDGAGNAVMMFGGNAGDARTWMFSGTAWTELSGGGPSARSKHAIAGIGTSQGPGAVMFGGSSAAFVDFAETWVLSPASALAGASWTLVSPSSVPSARRGHGFVSTVRPGFNTALLFGGYRGGGAPTHFNDTWTWNPAVPTWSVHSSAGCPPRPSARRNHVMAYDPARDRVVMFGGEDASTSAAGGWHADLWEWDHSCWRPIARPASAPWPDGRRNAAMVYDPERGRVLMFGGDGPEDTPQLDDLWGLTGDASNPWVELTPAASSMTPRSATALAFDAARSQVVLFGGQTGLVVNGHTYVLSRGRDQRPGVRWMIDWTYAGVDTASIRDLTFFAFAAGRGYSRRSNAPAAGAALRLWDPLAGRWVLVASNAAPLGAASSLTYATPTVGWAQRFVSATHDRIEAMITSVGVDYRAEPGQVQMETLGLRVSYRL